MNVPIFFYLDGGKNSKQKENIELINLEGYKKSNDEERYIKNRFWYTGDGRFSPSAQIFSIKATYYSCLMNKKLYAFDVDNLEAWGNTYRLKPYTLLFKCEGGIQFSYCNYTFWNKLINELPHNTINNCNYFELVNSSHKSNSYYGSDIPIHDLILFCKILENEGAYLSYNFDKHMR